MASNLTLLVVEDDPNDQELLQEALDEIGFQHRVIYLDDGEDLVAYVHRDEAYADRDRFPDPSVILLDLHMPRKGGLAALDDLQDSEHFWRIPVIVMTTSWSEEDVAQAYDLGVNAFLMKPVLYDALVTLVRSLSEFWFEHAELPSL
jgi:CheY-like chemotaxis protein